MLMGFFRIALCSLTFLGLTASSAQAATFVVSRTDDPSPDGCVSGTDCSLREAVIAANAADGGDSITLADGTYTLTISGNGEDAAATGDLDVTDTGDSLTVTGESAAGTILTWGGVTGSTGRLFQVVDGTLNLDFVTISDSGYPSGSEFGGAVLNESTLNVVGSIFSGNQANRGGAIASIEGILTITDSTITGNTGGSDGIAGGGVYFETTSIANTMEISGSEILDNVSNGSSGGGGGLAIVGGNNTIQRTTIAGNEAPGFGTAIYLTENVNAEAEQLLFINNTVIDDVDGTLEAGDTGDGEGVVHSFATANEGLDFANSFSTLVTANPAAHVFAFEDLGIQSLTSTASILDGGTDNCGTTAGTTIASGGYNVDNGDGCAFAGTGEITDQDPLLGPLEDHQGLNDTMAITSASPAYDASGTCDWGGGELATDQRGMTRPQGANCDIGAFEADQTAPLVTIDGDDPVTHECATTYTDEGGSAADNFYIDTPVVVDDSNLDPDAVGSYSVDLTSTDNEGNSGTETRTVNVVDTTDPVITLDGATLTVLQYADFSDPGYFLDDTCDPTFTQAADYSGAGTYTYVSTVDVTTVGSYTITYSATDGSGNSTEQVRTVNVVSRGTAVSVTPLENNQVQVEYEDGSTQTFTVFDKGSAKPRAKLSKDRERVVVLKRNGKKLRVIDATSGARLDTITLRKNPQGRTKLKVFNWYPNLNEKEEIIVSTRLNRKVRTSIISLTAASNFRNKNTERYEPFAPNDWRLKKIDRTLRLKRLNGDLFAKYKVTKKGNLLELTLE